MKILGIIPARGGSKGITKKNIKLLNNKHLIAYTIEAALASNLDRVIVSTECSEIASISREYGAEVIIRPIYLAEDKTPTLPVLKDVVSKLNEKYEAVMTLQPTSPFRTIEDINNSLEIFKSEKPQNANPQKKKVSNIVPEPLCLRGLHRMEQRCAR